MSFPMIFPDDTARVRKTDPLESHAAADATVGKVAASQAIVYRILSDSPRPLTDEEIVNEAHWYGFWSASRLRTARHELVEQGRVEAVGTVRKDGRRCRMNLWSVVA